MRRDKYFERKKYYTHLKNESKRLNKELKNTISIPLEKPQFAGWDITVEFSESGKRRQDYPELQEVLNVLAKVGFTKDVKYIQHIRRQKHTLESLFNYYKSIRKYSKFRTEEGYYTHVAVFKKSLSKKEFQTLPVHLKPSFSLFTYKDKYGKERYPLKKYFPLYELKVKITKAYYYARKVPNSEAESEEKKIDNIIYGREIGHKVWGWTRYKRSYSRMKQLAERRLSKLLKDAYNAGTLDDDVEVLYRRYAGVDKCRQIDWY